MHAAKMWQGSTATQEQQQQQPEQQTPQRRRPSGSFLNRSGPQTGFRSPRRRPVLPSATGRQGTAAAAVRRRRCVRVSFDRRRSSRSCSVSLKTDPLINCSISESSELKVKRGEGTHIVYKRGWLCTRTMPLGECPSPKGAPTYLLFGEHKIRGSAVIGSKKTDRRDYTNAADRKAAGRRVVRDTFRSATFRRLLFDPFVSAPEQFICLPSYSARLLACSRNSVSSSG